MADVEKINISITPRHAEFPRDYITGLRAIWTEGKVSGSATDVDFTALLNEARSKLISIRSRGR